MTRHANMDWRSGAGVVPRRLQSSGDPPPRLPRRPAGAPDRAVLPMAYPSYPASTEIDARKATPPPRYEVKPPAGAPNVVLILLDDFGFGQASAFGGGVEMPNLDRLAANGLRYNNFHVAALCSPTRVALLTGRNHHSANAGAVMDIATAYPGQQRRAAQQHHAARGDPPAERLQHGGLRQVARDGAVGGERLGSHRSLADALGLRQVLRVHRRRDEPVGADDLRRHDARRAAPGRELPLHDGHDQPGRRVGPPAAGPHARPSLLHVLRARRHARAAPGARARTSRSTQGRFDEGWDKYREDTLARQKKLGVVPPDTKLSPKAAAIKDWSALTPDERKIFARQMEVYAAFGEQADAEIGRLLGAIEELGKMDNTLIIYIVGDNGASPEGGMMGVVNEAAFFNGVPEPLSEQVKYREQLGGPATYAHYAAGWAVAGNTPFQYGKQVASAAGGNQNPMVIQWPKRIKDKGGLRSQFQYVTDIAPTILEAAGLPQPTTVNGIKQRPMEGASLLATIDDAKAATKHDTQYFEIGGNRGVYHDGWFAGTVHRAPWEQKPRTDLANDVWELYHVTEDFSQSTNLAASNPAKLKELQALFLAEAAKYQVLPIDDCSIERMDPAVAGRPDLMGGRTSLTLYPGAVAMAENTFINVKNRSHSITATADIPKGGAEGVIIAQAGRFSGWSLYVKDGRPAYAYNWLGRETYKVAGPDKLPEGPVTIAAGLRLRRRRARERRHGNALGQRQESCARDASPTRSPTRSLPTKASPSAWTMRRR